MVDIKTKIKDMEVHLAKEYGGPIDRNYKEEIVFGPCSADSISLQDLINDSTNVPVDLNELRFCCQYVGDDDYGTPEVDLYVYYLREETDEEHFESLSNECGCPELVSDEYNLYLQLKRKFEGKAYGQ